MLDASIVLLTNRLPVEESNTPAAVPLTALIVPLVKLLLFDELRMSMPEYMPVVLAVILKFLKLFPLEPLIMNALELHDELKFVMLLLFEP